MPKKASGKGNPRKGKKVVDRRSAEARQRAFLEEFAEAGSISRAAKRARVGRRTHYNWFGDPRQVTVPEEIQRYRNLFLEARRRAGDTLEGESFRRAADGWLEPVYYQGAVVGRIRRFDSGLAQFLLRGLKPDVYGAKTEVTGPAGAPLQAEITVTFVRPGEATS